MSSPTDSSPSPSGAPWLVELDHVSRLYGTVIGVNDLCCQLAPGAYGLVGPNGAGKSTLVGLLTGSIRPTIGNVRVFGVNPSSRQAVRQRIGLCPASDVLIPNTTARQWIEHLLAISGWPPRQARERTNEVVGMVSMGDRIDTPMNQYSLGMRQRIKLAQAIAHEPDLLILDEPFNGLDPVGRKQMTDLLRQWVASGRSLLLCSHVLHEVEAITQSFLMIYGGRLLAMGQSGELRELLSELPQEIEVFGADAPRVAERLVGQPWVGRVQLIMEQSMVRVAAQQPMRLLETLRDGVLEHDWQLDRIRGGGSDLATLFRLLVDRHRGQRLKR
jgi:ABC-2 type transport system ATP-binding protein